MTSKNSFFKLSIENSKRQLWSIAVSILLLLFSLPVYSAIQIARWNERLSVNRTTFADIILSYGKNIIGPKNFLLLIVTIVLSILLALGGFSFLFSKSKVDLYHSLPLKRSRLFFISYINGILYFAVPYLVFLMITIAIGGGYHVLTAASLATALTVFLLNLAGFIMLYSFMILAILLTGNGFVSLLAEGVFLIYGPAIKLILTSFCTIFFSTFYNGHISNNLFSPLALYVNLINDQFFGIQKHTCIFAFHLGATLVLIVGLLILNLFLYNKRPSEAAGHSLSFEKTKPFIKILIMIPVTLAGGLIFLSLRDSNASGSDTWMVFGFIIALLLSHGVIEIIYEFDFKAAFHHLYHLAVAGLISAVIVCIFRFDLFGYDNYLPQADAVDTVAISAYNLQNYIDYFGEAQPDGFDTSVDPDSPNNYVDPDFYRLSHMKLTDTASALDIAKVWKSDTQAYKSKQEMNSDDNLVFLNYAFRLKNGKEVFRSYPVNLKEHLDLYDKVFSTKEYKDGVFPALTSTEDTEKEYHLYWAMGDREFKNIFTEDEAREFLDIYRKELYAQSAYDLAAAPIAVINYLPAASERQNRYGLHTLGCIYESFTETISYLKQHEIDLLAYRDTDNITSLEVNHCVYDDITSDLISDTSQEYNNPAQIKTLMESMILSDYSYNDYLFQNTDDSYTITATYKSTDPKSGNVCSFTLKADQIPDFIQKDLPVEE